MEVNNRSTTMEAFEALARADSSPVELPGCDPKISS